jgi:PHD/YefM family antitoxin component YafN of YafNO toxin-antitoxin module
MEVVDAENAERDVDRWLDLAEQHQDVLIQQNGQDVAVMVSLRVYQDFLELKRAREAREKQ